MVVMMDDAPNPMQPGDNWSPVEAGKQLMELITLVDAARSNEKWLRGQKILDMLKRIKDGLEWTEREIVSGAPWEGLTRALGNGLLDSFLLVVVAERDFGKAGASFRTVCENACNAVKRRCPAVEMQGSAPQCPAAPADVPVKVDTRDVEVQCMLPEPMTEASILSRRHTRAKAPENDRRGGGGGDGAINCNVSKEDKQTSDAIISNTPLNGVSSGYNSAESSTPAVSLPMLMPGKAQLVDEVPCQFAVKPESRRWSVPSPAGTSRVQSTPALERLQRIPSLQRLLGRSGTALPPRPTDS
eukprot:TRINITY_DN64299_c0_g1_i1.p1 TRINITY_DN64299_c0_g1~~TRINITY_DN64299_c0_g1_i1.p1  ORF type:complete len:300 (+),score=43.46 TRINITY_DN64299_c0_g1_i1:292-1191(+)